MNVKERIAYLQGVVEGSDAFASEPRLRGIFDGLLEVCQELSEEVEQLRSQQEDAQAYLDAMDDDLADLEDAWHHHTGDDEDEADDEMFVEMACPNCGEDVYFEETFLDDDEVEISCPECGGVVYSPGEEPVEELDSSIASEGDNHRV